MINSLKTESLNAFRWLLAIGFLIIIVCFNYYLPRTNFIGLVSLFTGAFTIYLAILTKPFFKLNNHFKWIIGLGILARFIILFSIPNLSNDYFRFIWDGLLINNGTNPFDFIPSDLLKLEELLGQNNLSQFEHLYTEMNSPKYFSVYPTFNQYIFTIATFLFPKSIYGAVVVMKSFMFLFELLSIFSIYKISQQMGLNKHAVLWYVLNPLIIIEFCGNLHFEGAMIAFVLFSIYLLIKNNWVLSAIVFSGAILTKLHPLMLLPFFFKHLGFKKGLSFIVLTGLAVLLLSFPFAISTSHISQYLSIDGSFPFYLKIPFRRLDHIFTSLQLYFQSFEYNASIYYIARWIGYQITGFNEIKIIGKILFAINIIALAILFFKQKRTLKSLITNIAIVYLIYSLLATTVHPWYTLVILPFALLINFRMPIIWSGLVILSYFAYSTADWHENFYFLFIEYTIIFAVLIYELINIKKTRLIDESE